MARASELPACPTTDGSSPSMNSSIAQATQFLDSLGDGEATPDRS